MRVVLNTITLARACSDCHGHAKDLLSHLIGGPHVLLVSDELLTKMVPILIGLGKPVGRRRIRRPQYHSPKLSVSGYIGYLRDASEIVTLDPMVPIPIRNPHDAALVQTAVIGAADVICATPFDATLQRFLAARGISVMNEIALLRRLGHDSTLSTLLWP